MIASNIYINDLYVNEGEKLKRHRPKARGDGGEIQKKTSHVRLVLAEKVPGMKAQKKVQKKADHDHDQDHPGHTHETKPKSEKPEVKTELGKKVDSSANTKRRWFQRKSV